MSRFQKRDHVQKRDEGVDRRGNQPLEASVPGRSLRELLSENVGLNQIFYTAAYISMERHRGRPFSEADLLGPRAFMSQTMEATDRSERNASILDSRVNRRNPTHLSEH